MLPNWLYGKSKSKLQEILGGGGGTPADIAFSNPNILHNPWFTVNQRGVTSVTVNNEFIADRWSVWSAAGFSATRNSNDFIVIDNSSGDQPVILYQKRTTTYLTSLVGNKLTASVLLSDGTIYSGTITYDGSSKDYTDNEYIRLYAPSSATNQILGLSVKPGASVTVRAVKLELGSVSTLAMDTAPDMATELLKCQRYFVRIDNTAGGILLGTAIALNNDRASVCIKFPVSMIAKPSVTGITNLQIVNGVSTITAESISSSAHDNGYEALSVVATGTTQGTAYLVRLASGGYIDFSAEL